MSRLSLRRVVLATITAIAALGGSGLVGATAAAQTPAPGTLTVTGFGSASAPAETVGMQLLAILSEYIGGPPTERACTPNAASGDIASPIMVALQDVDVPGDAVKVVTSPALISASGPGAQARPGSTSH